MWTFLLLNCRFLIVLRFRSFGMNLGMNETSCRWWLMSKRSEAERNQEVFHLRFHELRWRCLVVTEAIHMFHDAIDGEWKSWIIRRGERKEKLCRQNGGKRLIEFMPISVIMVMIHQAEEAFSRFHGNISRLKKKLRWSFKSSLSTIVFFAWPEHVSQFSKIWFVFNCAIGINFDWSSADLSQMQMNLERFQLLTS